jgi:hypothetical protein
MRNEVAIILVDVKLLMAPGRDLLNFKGVLTSSSKPKFDACEPRSETWHKSAARSERCYQFLGTDQPVPAGGRTSSPATVPYNHVFDLQFQSSMFCWILCRCRHPPLNCIRSKRIYHNSPVTTCYNAYLIMQQTIFILPWPMKLCRQGDRAGEL